MNLIYTPKGRAREYSPLVLNIYTGCDNGCTYCYGKGWPWQMDNTHAVPRKDILEKLEKELAKGAPKEQVLLSFIGDPYCKAEMDHNITQRILYLFDFYKVPTAILTKGGSRCLRDLDFFKVFRNGNIKVGTTLTFIDKDDSLKYEPGAAIPEDRLNTLRTLHENGIKTWVSLEPVLDAEQAFALIDASHEFVDEYRVGKWNHSPEAGQIDWEKFGDMVLLKLRRNGCRFYIKKDLQKHIKERYLWSWEIDMDRFNLKAETEGKQS